MTLAISGHGTLLARQPAASPGVWTTIAELQDITPPELSRNEFDATTQDRNIDSYILGVLRRSDMTVQLNFLPGNTTHDNVVGLQAALTTEPPPVDGYRVTYPDGTAWIMSGQVKGFKPMAPVDGKLSASVTFRFSGRMSIGGVQFG